GLSLQGLGPGRRRRLESPARRGEHVYAVNQSRGEGRVAPVEPVVTFLLHSTGATSIRSSLRPLNGRDRCFMKLGRPASRDESPWFRRPVWPASTAFIFILRCGKKLHTLD